jgi:hypothetical protein
VHVLRLGGERISYRDPSGMTVAKVWLVLASELFFEGFFSLSAILRRCACADLPSAIEDDPLVAAHLSFIDVRAAKLCRCDSATDYRRSQFHTVDSCSGYRQNRPL